MAEIKYMTGFGNEFATEAEAGALPQGQNAPQHAPLGLYTEQLSGTPFTSPRAINRRTWSYRIRPSVMHEPYAEFEKPTLMRSGPFNELPTPPNQMRWNPLPFPDKTTDFVEGIVTLGGNGDPSMQDGVGIHLYAANASMHDRFFYNADGEMLILPQQGRLLLRTELGVLEAAPGELAVIPRGIKFRVELPDKEARGYICENYGQSFRLPELGPIGANGLANSRDFLTPVAAYEDREGAFEVICEIPRQAVARGDRSLAARCGRVARQLRALQVRHGALQLHQHGQLRSSRSVDLHRADRALEYARHGQCRLRHLSAALDGGRAHLPSAVVPPQHDERVHGPDPRPVRRQGGRLSARRRQPAQLHERPRPRRGDVREGEPRRTRSRNTSEALWRSCSRRACRCGPRALPSKRKFCSTNTTNAGRA